MFCKVTARQGSAEISHNLVPTFWPISALFPNEGPIRDRMVFQERRVHRLREQVESMMEANRRCDVMRRRQEAFLGHLIEKYQGDNVPLTADLCRQYCSLFEVRQAEDFFALPYLACFLLKLRFSALLFLYRLNIK